jgi:hypothetical protein
MRPVRRRDRQNRDVLKNLFRRKDNAALVDPKEDYMTDDSGKPILNLLPEAEVAGTKTQYEEADLAKAGLLALREAGGMVPGIDYALDAAELENISRTGKDFYGDETTPESYAAMVGAGMLLPGVLKRAGRGIGKAAKKFFKFGKKSKGEFDAFNEGLDDIFDDVSKDGPTLDDVPVRKKGFEVFPETKNQPYGSYTYPRDGVEGIPVATNADTQYGVEFSRRFYSSPDIQGHLRGRYYPDGYDVEKAALAADKLMIMDEARSKVLGELYRPGIKPGTNVAYQKEYDRRIAEELKGTGIPFRAFQNIYGPQSYFGHTGPNFQGLAEGTELEFLFRRGERNPDMLMDPDMLKNRGGVYEFNADNIYGDTTPSSDPFSKKGQRGSNRSLGTHEANHWANFRHFFGEGSVHMPKGQKNLANDYRAALVDATNESSHEFITGTSHWSRVGDDKIKKVHAYLSDPPEILARTQELRLAMSEALQNPPYMNLSQKQKADVLMGDLSSIGGEDGLQELISNASNLGKHVTDLPDDGFFRILKGNGLVGSFDKERLQSIQKLLKAGFVFTGAAGAYGAMDNQGGQPSNSMYAGGVITMRKKKKGMSTIRK